jgi:hypothetical protein
VDEVYFFRFDDGRIAAVWGLEDTAARQRQLGIARQLIAPGDLISEPWSGSRVN